MYGTSDIISGNMGDAVPPGTEANGGLATLKGPLLREVQKPLLFGNHQKQFQAFTLVVTIGVAYYFVFHHDFGSHRHVFSQIRDWKKEYLKKFFHVDPKDKELSRLQEQVLKNEK